MSADISGFLRSLTAGSGLRIAFAVVLTTASVSIAFRDSASPTLLIGCNLFTVAGAIAMEYKNYRARR